MNEKQQKLRELNRNLANLTQEQRQALTDKIGAVVTCAGRALSLHNTLLLAVQSNRAVPTVVGGPAQWRSVGREVLPEANPAGAIWVPTSGRKRDDDGNEVQRQTRFLAVSVYDITATRAIEAVA